MRIVGRGPARVMGGRSRARGRARTRWVALRAAAIALATGVVVLLAGGGEAFWLSIPAALAAGAPARTRLGTLLSAGSVIAAAAVPSIAVRPLPAPVLAVAVVVTSVMVMVAVRERLRRERDAMRDFALTDSLTGIANRRALLWRAEYEVARHARVRRRFAVVMLDLDGFKRLNDRFGHPAGDDLLRDVATALKGAMRGQDTVARLGGDEFCVLAPETGNPGTRRLAARIGQSVGEVTAGVESVRASLGIAVFPDDGTTAAALLEVADQRLLSAKRRPRRGRARGRAA